MWRSAWREMWRSAWRQNRAYWMRGFAVWFWCLLWVVALVPLIFSSFFSFDLFPLPLQFLAVVSEVAYAACGVLFLLADLRAYCECSRFEVLLFGSFAFWLAVSLIVFASWLA
jgi:hypothetical protein